ncbi:MAG: M28 family peptidase, partial [Chloroflexi bacterium]|nr:M28 family peptidase [Chloroflexota bacterium]
MIVEPAPYDNDFALTVLRALTVEIGPRARGTEGELAAADYLTATFESLGYEVERQAFTLPFESVSLVEVVVDGTALTADAFGGTVGGEVEARLVVVPGLGSTANFAQVDVTGAVALVERGVLFFQEKVDNAAAAGAVGIMIFNNDPGPFSGSLADGSTIPAVSLTQAAGQSLVDQVGQGEVVAAIRIEGGRRLATSENIIATTGDGSCAIYVGGHYDSVENVAGANDNGSGTSLVVALAQAFVGATGADEICFVGFAAEEAVGGIQGIAGSGVLVARLVATGAAADVFVMLNLDVTGAGNESVVAIGSSTFTFPLVRIANALGIPARVGNLPSNSGSDHLSFQGAGIPVIFATTTGASIHVASENFANIVPAVLDNLGRTAHAMLQCLLVGNGAPQEAPEGCDL